MLLLFTILAVAMTFAGGTAPLIKNMLSRPGMWRLFSLRAGILIGVAFTEVLPEAWSQDPSLAGWGAVAAFVLLFTMGSFAMLDSCPEYLEQCRVHYLGWAAFSALTIHSFIDGFNLGVSFSAGASAGIAVGIALSLHKLADGFTLTSLFTQAGMSRARSLVSLALVAAATPAGAAFNALGSTAASPRAAAALLGFAGGSFIYIGAADLVPRLHKAEDKSGLAYFGLGLLGMAALHRF